MEIDGELGEVPHEQATTELPMGLLVAGDTETHIGMLAMQSLHHLQHDREVSFHLRTPRAGEDSDRPHGAAVLAPATTIEERLIQAMFGDFVEERMPDVFHVNAPRAIPVRFERECGQHGIDPLANLANAPGGPGPQLGRQVVQRRDSQRLGGGGDPPVEPRTVDENHRIGLLPAKELFGPQVLTIERADDRHGSPRFP
jgi:hypothetical protein